MERKYGDFGNILNMPLEEKLELYLEYRIEFLDEYHAQYKRYRANLLDKYSKDPETGLPFKNKRIRRKADIHDEYIDGCEDFFEAIEKLDKDNKDEILVYDQDYNLVAKFNNREQCAEWIFDEIKHREFRKGTYSLGYDYEDYCEIETEEKYLWYLESKILDYIDIGDSIPLGFKIVNDNVLDLSEVVYYYFCDYKHPINYKKRAKKRLDEVCLDEIGNDDLPF